MANTCIYCEQGKDLNELMIYFTDLEVSKVYLFRDQTYYGRCVLAYKKHVKELFEIPSGDLEAFMRDMQRLSAAISKAVDADKINFGMYGDRVSHFHCHIVPKKEGGLSFGATFEMSANPPLHLSDAENQVIINKIQKYL